MKRAALLATAMIVAVAGCSKSPSPAPSGNTALATASATPAATGSAAPTVSASPALAFTVDGSGPYQLGANLMALQAAGQLDEVKTGGETCSLNTTARGTGVWKDVRMSFRPDGTIYIVINRSTTIPTPSGAWLGATLAALQSIYGNLGEELHLGAGVAYLVTTNSGRGIMFDLDASKKVISMVAGQSSFLKSSFLSGTDYC